MKILHITEKPRFSGAEILIKDLSLSHIDQHSVAITSFNPTEDDFQNMMQLLKEKGIELFIPDNALSKLNRLTFLFKVFREFQPDIVVGHSAIVSAYMRIVGVLFPKIKKVIVLHAAADYENSNRLQKAEYILQYFTDCVVGVSDSSRDVYQNRFMHVTCKTITNGIDLENFNSKHKRYRYRTRAEVFDVDDTSFVILQVGRINKIKNQLLTLKAVSMLENEKKQNVKIIFAGIIEDKEYYADINKFIEANNLMQNVEFLGARSDVNNLLYAADLFVMPSKRESFGIALVEALSTGIPTIYSGISQFDFLDKYNFENADQISLKDVNAFSNTILKTIQGNVSFVKRSLDDFSFEKCSREYLELFEEITK